MASIQIPDQNRQINDPREIVEFLAPFGIWYENWDVDSRVGSDATDEQILDAFAPEIERLKERGGFVTADIINVTADTPGLDQMMEKFNKEHTHSEDEVRFTVRGRGLFHIHPEGGPVFAILVESGDLINVPEGTRHWFNFCEDRSIRCIRLFQDKSGWAPHYVDDGVHERYAPVCLGPEYIRPADATVDPIVKP